MADQKCTMYTRVESVKARLTSKVQFQVGPTPVPGELPNALLIQLIQDAETDVEMALRSRYMIPFQSIRTGQFADLPDHSARVIRKIVDARAVMLILGTDFGRGSVFAGDPYYTWTKEQYEENINIALGRDAIGRNDKIDRFKYAPPLEDLRLAKTNELADDGYRGMVINTDSSPDAVTYAQDHLDDPSQVWYGPRRWRP